MNKMCKKCKCERKADEVTREEIDKLWEAISEVWEQMVKYHHVKGECVCRKRK